MRYERKNYPDIDSGVERGIVSVRGGGSAEAGDAAGA